MGIVRIQMILNQMPEMNNIRIGKDYIGVGCWGTIINDKNQTLLIKRKDNHVWERPGGKLEVGESFEQCIVREIKEETNLVVNPESMLLVEQNYDSTKESHWICIGYLCKYVSGQPQLLEAEKHDEIAWFDLNDLPQVTQHTKNALDTYNKNNKYYSS